MVVLIYNISFHCFIDMPVLSYGNTPMIVRWVISLLLLIEILVIKLSVNALLMLSSYLTQACLLDLIIRHPCKCVVLLRSWSLAKTEKFTPFKLDVGFLNGVTV